MSTAGVRAFISSLVFAFQPLSKSSAYRLHSGAASVLVKELGTTLLWQCALPLRKDRQETGECLSGSFWALLVLKEVSILGLPSALCWVEHPLWGAC